MEPSDNTINGFLDAIGGDSAPGLPPDVDIQNSLVDAQYPQDRSAISSKGIFTTTVQELISIPALLPLSTLSKATSSFEPQAQQRCFQGAMAALGEQLDSHNLNRKHLSSSSTFLSKVDHLPTNTNGTSTNISGITSLFNSVTPSRETAPMLHDAASYAVVNNDWNCQQTNSYGDSTMNALLNAMLSDDPSHVNRDNTRFVSMPGPEYSSCMPGLGEVTMNLIMTNIEAYENTSGMDVPAANSAEINSAEINCTSNNNNIIPLLLKQSNVDVSTTIPSDGHVSTLTEGALKPSPLDPLCRNSPVDRQLIINTPHHSSEATTELSATVEFPVIYVAKNDRDVEVAVATQVQLPTPSLPREILDVGISSADSHNSKKRPRSREVANNSNNSANYNTKSGAGSSSSGHELKIKSSSSSNKLGGESSKKIKLNSCGINSSSKLKKKKLRRIRPTYLGPISELYRFVSNVFVTTTS